MLLTVEALDLLYGLELKSLTPVLLLLFILDIYASTFYLLKSSLSLDILVRNEDLLKDLNKLIKPSNTIVMGDFNDLVLDDLDFVDGWNVCGAGQDFTFSRGDIQTRIDKFYYNAFDGNLIPIITNAMADLPKVDQLSSTKPSYN